MWRRPVTWMLVALASGIAAVLAGWLFPRVFPSLRTEIGMSRREALIAARALMARERIGPATYRETVRFAVDAQAVAFIDRQARDPDIFLRILRECAYSPYAWEVRHVRIGDRHDAVVMFRPDGRPYGLKEHLDERTPGPRLTAIEAQALAERTARETWQVDLAPYTLIESVSEARVRGRIDHTFIYERSSSTVGEGRQRLRLAVSGDRLTELTHLLTIPEAFAKRYESIRDTNTALRTMGTLVALLVFVVGGVGAGIVHATRQRWIIVRQPLFWGTAIAGLQLAATIGSSPSSFAGRRIAELVAVFFGSAIVFGVTLMAGESLTRRAFGSQPQLWRTWSSGSAASTAILGRTVAGYLLTPILLAYQATFYLFATRVLGWWIPPQSLSDPGVVASSVPWLRVIADAVQFAFWEELLVRAVPIAGAALIGDRLGRRRLFVGIALILQAMLFSASHATVVSQPAYARAVELLLPSLGFGCLYLAFGLLPAIILHLANDVVWLGLPLFMSSGHGAWIDLALVIGLTLIPLWIVVGARLRRAEWFELPVEARNEHWVSRRRQRAVPSSFLECQHE